MRRNHPQAAAIAIPPPDQMGQLVLRGAGAFVRRNKVVSGAYVFGLAVLLIFGGSAGRTLTQEQSREYNRILDSIDVQAEAQVTGDYMRARQMYYSSKGWFWSCDSMCQRHKHSMDEAERAMTAIRRESAARTSDAKRIAGLFSEVGMAEVHDSFWGYFESGKQFAKRQSMWDLMFMSVRSMTRGRDESWVEFGIKVLIQVLLNFSMGLVMALVIFVFGLWSIVRSYQPNPIIAVLFFCGAATAAFSFVTTYLLAVYGAAATGVYAVLKMADPSTGRIGNQQGYQRVQQGNRRPHYD